MEAVIGIVESVLDSIGSPRVFRTQRHKLITEREYRAFQIAYDFLNAELFSGKLPRVLVTLQRHAKARGYFAANRHRSHRGGLRHMNWPLTPMFSLAGLTS